MSFGGQLNCGWKGGVFGGNSGYSWYTKIDNLNRFLNRMQGIYISNTDALKCIKQWDSPQTFFYIDPPYVGANQGHYSGYTQEDLDKLIDLLQTIQGSFILSGYDNKNYPKNWEKFEFAAYVSSSGVGTTNIKDKSKKAENTGDRKRTEIVMRHITTKKVRPEIEKIYKKRNQKSICSIFDENT